MAIQNLMPSEGRSDVRTGGRSTAKRARSAGVRTSARRNGSPARPSTAARRRPVSRSSLAGQPMLPTDIVSLRTAPAERARRGAPAEHALRTAPTQRRGAPSERALLAPVVPLRAIPLTLVPGQALPALSLVPPASTLYVMPPRRTRLTTRGAKLLRTVLVAVALVVGIAVVVAGRSAGGDAAATPAATHAVVQPGQTLWSIATTALPELDPRDAIQEIATLNHLQPGDSVTPGQDLALPTP